MTDELNELTEFDEKLLVPAVKYLVFPRRGTRENLHHWVSSIQDLGVKLNDFLIHEGTRWPFGKVLGEASWIVERWQGENKRYYEKHEIIWRMGGRITDQLNAERNVVQLRKDG